MTPPARCLDLTRSASRAGRVPTGIDRVEAAYLAHFLAAPEPLWSLLRTRGGHLLLDPAATAEFAERLAGRAEWGRVDLLGRLTRRDKPLLARIEAEARRRAAGRSLRGRLGRMLRRRLPEGTVYFNVGQTALDDEVVDAVHGVPGGRVIVLIHDTIPLDHPDLSREGVPERFGRMLDAASGADLILCNSRATEAGLARHMAPLPETAIAPLGVEAAPPDPAALPPGLDLDAPFFVALGTIEPRKNHAMLLDLWEEMGAGAPRLLICGARGWRNEAVFARLDRGVPGVTELPGLSDGAVSALLERARALLFPSLAEGYGLPALEARALGCPVICGPLDIWREVLGDDAVYLPLDAPYLWRNEIVRLTEAPGPRPARRDPPGWAAHFAIVTRAT